MFQRRLFFALALLAASGLAGCAGSGMSAPAPPAGGASQGGSLESSGGQVRTQSLDVHVGPAPATTSLVLTPGVSGSLTLHSANANATVQVGTAPATSGRAATLSQRGCPPIPPIVIFNPSSHPITIAIDAFTIGLPCSVDGLLFGASAYQSYPVPQTLVSTKLGDATGTGHKLAFKPTVAQLTFPAQSALTISILAETSTAFAQLPAIANTTIALTSNAPSVPNSLSLNTPSVQGGTTFQSACFLPNDPNGPGLARVHVLGTPAFYCVLAPGRTGTRTTFGSSSSDIVKFVLGPNVKPDASLVGLDGPPIYAPCTPAGANEVCDAPAFAIPIYSRAIVSNLADIAACVPALANADCNGAAGNPKAPSATSVPGGRDFQLLFADDPSYNAANTFGGVTLQIAGTDSPCTINIGPDANGDTPPDYADPAAPSDATRWRADFAGTGPNAEFDIKAKAPGTCRVTLTEDTGLKRTFNFAITVRSS